MNDLPDPVTFVGDVLDLDGALVERFGDAVEAVVPEEISRMLGVDEHSRFVLAAHRPGEVSCGIGSTVIERSHKGRGSSAGIFLSLWTWNTSRAFCCPESKMPHGGLLLPLWIVLCDVTHGTTSESWSTSMHCWLKHGPQGGRSSPWRLRQSALSLSPRGTRNSGIYNPDSS